MLRARIKPGSLVLHDHRPMTWPDCFPPRNTEVDENMLFYAIPMNDGWKMIADGYGAFKSKNGVDGSYGNGEIFLMDLSSKC